MTNREWWAEVEKAVGAPDIDVPLETGTPIAWTLTAPGVGGERITCDVSKIHRVLDGKQTYCQLPVPAPHRRFPPLASLDMCTRCARLHRLGLTLEEIEIMAAREAVA